MATVEVRKTEYQSAEAYEITNGKTVLIVATGVGPRIIHFGFKNKENILFVKDSDFLNRSAGYKFYGGHRLWHAPEHIVRSYQPDNIPCEVEVLPLGVRVVSYEPENKLEKSMQIEMKESGRVRIVHKIVNRSTFDLTLATWGITQLKAGGMAVMPLDTRKTGLLPNKSVSFWEYSDLGDKRVTYLKNQILIKQDENVDKAFKLGTFNRDGYLAYFIDGDLFVKEFDVTEGEHVDFGCNSEIYVDKSLLELESLSPIETLAENESVSHVEVWELFEKVSNPALTMAESVDMKDFVNA